MKPNSYLLLERCIEDGIKIGYRRAFKHDAEPDEEKVADYIQGAIMHEVAQWFAFDDLVTKGD